MPKSGGKKPIYPGLYNRHLDEMRNLLNTLDPDAASQDDGALAAPMDIYETESEIVVEFDLPGIQLSSINLVQRGLILFLEVEKKAESREGQMKYICMERNFGRFTRSVRMPDNIDPVGIRAEYHRGVLKVFCPKGCERRIIVKEQ